MADKKILAHSVEDVATQRCLRQLQDDANELRNQIDALEGGAGPAGEDGEDGATGPTGPAGPAPAGTGFVRVTSGVLDTTLPAVTAAELASNAVTTAKILDANVTLAKLANIAAARVIGSVAGGVPAELTPTQVTALLNTLTSVLQGLVPASGGGTANFIRADGSWAVPRVGIGLQYFGPGLDGALVFDGSSVVLGMTPSANIYTMTRDIGATNITINNGVTVKMAGFRVFAMGTVTINGTLSATGSAGTTGNAGAAAVAGSVGGGTIGGTVTGAGGVGGTQAAAISHWELSAGVVIGGLNNTLADGGDGLPGNVPGRGGGGGGAGGFNAGGPNAGSGGTLTSIVVGLAGMSALMNGVSDNVVTGGTHLRYIFGTGGGGCSSADGGGGGGGGGLAVVCADVITGTGTITVAGGNGGNGQARAVTAGGGGGGGGGGGVIVLVYNTRSGSLTLTVAGGNGGNGGVGSTYRGGNGGVGADGDTFTFNLSGDGT